MKTLFVAEVRIALCPTASERAGKGYRCGLTPEHYYHHMPGAAAVFTNPNIIEQEARPTGMSGNLGEQGPPKGRVEPKARALTTGLRGAHEL